MSASAPWRRGGWSRGARPAGRGRGALRGYLRLVQGLAPARTLARGFSITRREDGALLRRPQEARPGARLITELARARSRAGGGTMSAKKNEDARPSRLRRGDARARGDPGPGERDEVDLDRLAAELGRAAELLEACRAKIRRAELEVTRSSSASRRRARRAERPPGSGLPLAGLVEVDRGGLVGGASGLATPSSARSSRISRSRKSSRTPARPSFLWTCRTSAGVTRMPVRRRRYCAKTRAARRS